MFVGIGLLVLAGLCWVVIGIAVSRCSAEKLSYNIVQMIASSGTALVCIPILLLPDQWPQLPWRILLGVFLLHFAAGMANYFNYVLLEKAMRMGHNGIVWGIMQSGLLAPFLMGVFFFHVPVPLWRVGGILAILGGIILLSTTKNLGKEYEKSRGGKWFVPAFGAFLLAGATQCCNNLPSYWQDMAESGSVFRTFASMAGNSAGFLLALLFDPSLRRFGNCKEWKIGTGLFILFCLCNILFFYRGMNLVADAGAGAIAYPIPIGICIIGFTLYSILQLKEHLSVPGWIGLTALALGILGISLR